MEIKIKSYSSQSSLIESIIFFIVGAILFSSADAILSFVSIGVGIILAIYAIVEIVIYFVGIHNQIYPPRTSHLIRGIISIIFAVIFIFFSNIVEQSIRFIVGAWILLTGITRLINALSMNKKNTKFWPLLIVSLLIIGIGIYTIVKGDIILTTIGIIMMIYSAIEIIGYIFYSKDTIKPEEEGTETLIIPESENNPKKVKKIKHSKNSKDSNNPES